MTQSCKNRQPVSELNQKPLQYQDGWNPDGTRRMIVSTEHRWAEIQCGHTERQDDPECAGCRYRG